MKKLLTSNPNTKEYWQDVYSQEINSHKNRVDKYRLQLIEQWLLYERKQKGEVIKLVDFGCGLGDVAKYLFQYSDDIVLYAGVDISPFAIQYNKKKFIESADQFKFFAGQDLKEFQDNSIDFIFCGETLEHISEPEVLLMEFKNKLKTNGLLLITVPNEAHNVSDEHVWEWDYRDILELTPKLGKLLFLNTVEPEDLCLIAVWRIIK